MKYELVGEQGYRYLKIYLDGGEDVYAQPGAYLYHKGELELDTKTFGGIFGGLKKSIFGGEGFFINHYYARTSSVIAFAPALPGQIFSLDLNGPEGYYIRDGAYLLHHGNVAIDTKFFGLKGIFSSGGLFWLNAKGNGKIWLNVYGAVDEIALEGDEIYVDNYNLVAYTEGLNVELKKLGGFKSFIFGGEGFVFKISGHGKVYVQSRSFPSFINLISANIVKG